MGRIRSSKIRSWIRIQNISFRIHNTAILYIFRAFKSLRLLIQERQSNI